MPGSQETPNPTVEIIRAELGQIRKEALKKAVNNGSVPVLARLAQELATEQDPPLAERISNGTAAERHQATAEQIKALLDPVLRQLDGGRDKVVVELFDLGFNSNEPDEATRRANAAALVFVTSGSFRRWHEPPLLKKLATLLADEYGGRLLPSDDDAQQAEHVETRIEAPDQPIPKPGTTANTTTEPPHTKVVTPTIGHSKSWLLAGLGIVIGVAVLLGLLLTQGTAPTNKLPPTQQASWGPARPAFTSKNPPAFITFDSITDNPVASDERDFLTAYPPGSTDPQGVLRVHDKELVILRAYFENDAAPNLNLYASDTRLAMQLPTEAATKQNVTGFISASNARPTTVWATVRLTALRPFYLVYDKGTAALWNNTTPAAFWGTSRGVHLSDDIVTSHGVSLGCGRHLNGRVSGDITNCAGWVTVRVRIVFA